MNEEAMARVGPQRHKKKNNEALVEDMWTSVLEVNTYAA